ncbi:MAG: divalent cation tolerance protein CutA [Patescibacteria group bacterium]
MKIVWVLVNCNGAAEARKIGTSVLHKRLAACFDIFDRRGAWYFWPPRSGKIEHSKGCQLVLATLPKHVRSIRPIVQRLHSDKLPFIGTLEIGAISAGYLKWMKDELKS